MTCFGWPLVYLLCDGFISLPPMVCHINLHQNQEDCKRAEHPLFFLIEHKIEQQKLKTAVCEFKRNLPGKGIPWLMLHVTCYCIKVEEEKNIASNILLCMYTLNGKQYNEGEILCTQCVCVHTSSLHTYMVGVTGTVLNTTISVYRIQNRQVT